MRWTGRPHAESAAATHERYRSDIQGLRAIAILGVLIYHANEDWLGGGFLGVDVFFVISGYLITGILVRELARGEMSIAGFYQRRVRRLFPALFVVLAVVLAVGWLLLPPAELRELGRTTLSTTFFVSNIDFLHLTDYFDGEADRRPLLHTWSLAVEEQFYIIFPLLLAALWPLGKKQASVALALLFLGSLLLSAWLAVRAPGDAFYLAPARAFQLLIGALVALDVAPAVKRAATRDNLSVAGLALIGVSFAAIDDNMPVPGLPALAPCLGVAMLLHAGRDGPTRAGRWISNPMFLFFGAISYSLYLWHWPLLVYAREISFGRPEPLLIMAAVALAVLLAYLSYRFIEQPFLRGRQTTLRTLTGGGAVMAAGAAAGLVLFLGDGAPSRYSPRALALFAGAEDYSARRTECHQEDVVPIGYDQNCLFGAERVAPTIAVWGDSNGIELAAALGERVAPRGQAVMQITATLCPPALYYDPARRPLCAQRNVEALERLSTDTRIRTVVLVANLPHYGEKDADRIAAGYRAVVSRLVAAGKQVVLVAPTPMMPNDPPRALGAWDARGRDPYAYGVTRVEHEARSAWAASLLTDIARTNQVDVVDPADVLCGDSLCRAVGPDRERPLYYDRAHLSMSGARLLAERTPLR